MVQHPVVLRQGEVKLIIGQVGGVALLRNSKRHDLGFRCGHLLNQSLLVRHTLTGPNVIHHTCAHSSAHVVIAAFRDHGVHVVLRFKRDLHLFIVGSEASTDDAPAGVCFEH